MSHKERCSCSVTDIVHVMYLHNAQSTLNTNDTKLVKK